MIDNFVRRLSKIGIDVKLLGNYPWIYLQKVNDQPVSENFAGNHGFTAFFLLRTGDVKFSDRRTVFNKIREMVGKNK